MSQKDKPKEMLPKEGERERLETREESNVSPPSDSSPLSLSMGEPNPVSTPAALSSGAALTPEQIEAERVYLEALERETASLPMSWAPPAEYEFQYSPDKIELLYQRGLIGKKKYDDWKKKKVGADLIGDWNCRFCQFRKVCVPTQKNHLLSYQLYDMDDMLPVEDLGRKE